MKIPKHPSLIVAIMLLSVTLVSAADWKNDGAFFYTANQIAEGTEIKIKVASGEFDNVRIGEFFGPKKYGIVGNELRVWEKIVCTEKTACPAIIRTQLIPGQVLSYTLPKTMTVSICTANHRPEAMKVTHQTGFDELQFSPGWVLQVAIPQGTFNYYY
jgi:hypothetical protein